MEINYIEAYLCECGHAMSKYLRGILCGYDRFEFHNCCSKCGRTRDKIRLVTGYFKQKKITEGIWPFKSVRYEDVEFVQSEFNNMENKDEN